ncbi:MAG: hypothetical protein WCV55_01170 [Candidatus Paceibacterota bacterium]
MELKSENYSDPNIPRMIKRNTGKITTPEGASVQTVLVEINKPEEFLKFRPKNSEFSRLDNDSWLEAIGLWGVERQLTRDYMDWTLGQKRSFLSLGTRFEELFPKKISTEELAIAKQKFFSEEHPIGSLDLFDEWFQGSGLPIELRIPVLKEMFEIEN